VDLPYASISQARKYAHEARRVRVGCPVVSTRIWEEVLKVLRAGWDQKGPKSAVACHGRIYAVELRV
jgi:hypothetical protein